MQSSLPSVHTSLAQIKIPMLFWEIFGLTAGVSASISFVVYCLTRFDLFIPNRRKVSAFLGGSSSLQPILSGCGLVFCIFHIVLFSLQLLYDLKNSILLYIGIITASALVLYDICYLFGLEKLNAVCYSLFVLFPSVVVLVSSVETFVYDNNIILFNFSAIRLPFFVKNFIHALDITSQLLFFTLTCLLSLVVTVGSSIYCVERSSSFDSNPGRFATSILDGVFYMFLTLLTVGFGDFSPSNWLARLVAIMGLVVGVVITVKYSRSLRRHMSIISYRSSTKGTYEILVAFCGNLQIEDLLQVLPECERLVSNMNDVSFLFVLDPRSGPFKGLNRLVSKYISLKNRVKIVFTGLLDRQQVESARLSSVDHFIFLPPIYPTSSQKEDEVNISKIFTIRSVFDEVSISAFFRIPENEKLFQMAGVSNRNLFCIQELEHNLLSARNAALSYGTFLESLMQDGRFGIFECIIPSAFAGITYAECFVNVLVSSASNGSALLIGVRRENGSVLINPGPQYRVPDHEPLTGIFIAPNIHCIRFSQPPDFKNIVLDQQTELTATVPSFTAEKSNVLLCLFGTQNDHFSIDTLLSQLTSTNVSIVMS